MNAVDNPLAIGSTILYYNRRTRFNNLQIRDSFRQLTKKEALQLEEGDTFWTPYFKSSKVDGYTRLIVTRCGRISDTEKIIHHNGGSHSTDLYVLFYQIKDGAKEHLLRLIEGSIEDQLQIGDDVNDW